MVHEQAVDAVIDIKRNEAIGQDSLFGGDAEAEAVFDIPVPTGEWDKSTLLNFEREMLGLYVSDHPLFGIEHIIARESDCALADLTAEDTESRPRSGDRSDAQIVKVGGILSGVQRKVTKQGNQWAAATLEDLAGAIEVLFFPQTYQLYATSITEDAVVVVKGKVDRRDDVPKLIAMDLTLPDLSIGRLRSLRGVHVRRPVRAAGRGAAARGAGHPPGDDRGPPEAARPRADHAGPAWTTNCE